MINLLEKSVESQGTGQNSILSEVFGLYVEQRCVCVLDFKNSVYF